MFIGVYWSPRPSDVTMRRDDTIMVWVTWGRSVPDKLKMNINTFYSAAAALSPTHSDGWPVVGPWWGRCESIISLEDNLQPDMCVLCLSSTQLVLSSVNLNLKFNRFVKQSLKFWIWSNHKIIQNCIVEIFFCFQLFSMESIINNIANLIMTNAMSAQSFCTITIDNSYKDIRNIGWYNAMHQHLDKRILSYFPWEIL